MTPVFVRTSKNALHPLSSVVRHFQGGQQALQVKSGVPSHLKTLRRGTRKGCSSFHTPARNSCCKLIIQVTGRNTRLSRLTSSQMPSLQSGSLGPDCVQATGSLRPGLKGRVDHVAQWLQVRGRIEAEPKQGQRCLCSVDMPPPFRSQGPLRVGWLFQF